MTTLSYHVARDVETPMRDGVVLRGDVWLPDGPGPFAAIVFRTPYNKSQLVSDFLRPQQAVEAGFAVVVQDCRGRFRSEGRWRPLMWAQEGEDGYDTVEWTAAQAWCSGAVGMAGPSYLGIVQLAAAVLKPPHLRAIAPAICSVARHERPERGGAFWLDHLFGWTAGMTADWALKQRAGGATLSPRSEATLALALEAPRRLMDHRPLAQSPLFDLPGFDIDFERLSRDTATPDLDVSKIEIPILSAGGWFDLYIRGTLGLFADRPARSERRVVVGPWVHSAVLPSQAGQMNFGARASGAAALLHQDHLAFFKQHLRGEAGRAPPVRYFMMGQNRWRESPAWPPPESRPQRLFLRAGGALGPEPAEAGQPVDRYRFDPDDPTPTTGGRTMPSGATMAGPIDQAALARRPDVLCYETPAIADPLDIVGAPCAVIHVQATTPSFDVIVKLVDVAPDGVALAITDGVRRVQKAAGDGHFHRVDVDLADTAWRVLPGHRLRVQVQSGDYPHFDANPGTGHRLGADAAGLVATIGVALGGGHASHVDFRTLPPGAA